MPRAYDLARKALDAGHVDAAILVSGNPSPEFLQDLENAPRMRALLKPLGRDALLTHVRAPVWSKDKARSLALLAAAEVAALAMWFSATAVIPALRDAFDLSDTHASLLSSTVSVGFVAATLISASLGVADRVAPKRLFVLGALGASLATCSLFFVDPSHPAIGRARRAGQRARWALGGPDRPNHRHHRRNEGEWRLRAWHRISVRGFSGLGRARRARPESLALAGGRR